MLYADLRGHHGKRWNYEPSDWYMGKNKHKKKQEYIMPMVNGKKYAYTKKGKAAAKKAMKKKKKKK